MTKSRLTHKQRQCLRRINWDYNISEEDMYDVITGKKSHPGHWDFDDLLIRMLERLRWYDLLDMIGPDILQEKLRPEILRQLHSPEKKKNMNALGKYYEEKLYPLQNGILSIVKKSRTPFFLTGGTALSRHCFLLMSFPVKQLEYIKWIKRPKTAEFDHDIKRIADDIFYGKDNSLAPNTAENNL